MRYGVYAGYEHPYEVWTENHDLVKLEKISGHRTSDEAHEARRRYQAADKRRMDSLTLNPAALQRH